MEVVYPSPSETVPYIPRFGSAAGQQNKINLLFTSHCQRRRGSDREQARYARWHIQGDGVRIKLGSIETVGI